MLRLRPALTNFTNVISPGTIFTNLIRPVSLVRHNSSISSNSPNSSISSRSSNNNGSHRLDRGGFTESQVVLEAQRHMIQNYPFKKSNTVINICQKGQEMVITRFGKELTVHKEGLFLSIPLIDQIKIQDMREQCIRIEGQISITSDNSTMVIGCNLYYRVLDSRKATFNVNQPIYAMVQHAQASLRRSLGGMTMDETFSSRHKINDKVRSDLRESCPAWGIEPLRIEVTQVDPLDDSVRHSMDQQAIAERTRREDVSGAEAKKRSVELVSEGQKVKLINEADGNYYRIQKEAEGALYQAQKKAEADAYAQKARADAEAYETETKAWAESEAIKVRAEAAAKAVELAGAAQAEALNSVADALNTVGGSEAAQIDLAKAYASTLAQIGSKSTTMFIPENMGDLPRLMGLGMNLAKTLVPQSK